jgi:hypothetical protein
LLASSHRTCTTYSWCCVYSIRTHDDWLKYRPKHVVLFRNKTDLGYYVSGWFYYRNILRCTALQTSDLSN